MPVAIAVREEEFRGKPTLKLVVAHLSKTVDKNGDDLIFKPVPSKMVELLHTLRDNGIPFREYEDPS